MKKFKGIIKEISMSHRVNSTGLDVDMRIIGRCNAKLKDKMEQALLEGKVVACCVTLERGIFVTTIRFDH